MKPENTRAVFLRAHALAAISVLSGIAAVIALVVSLTVQGDQIQTIQRAREAASVDNCYVLRGLVVHAFPARRRAAALRLLADNGLGDCRAYGRSVLTVKGSRMLRNALPGGGG